MKTEKSTETFNFHIFITPLVICPFAAATLGGRAPQIEKYHSATWFCLPNTNLLVFVVYQNSIQEALGQYFTCCYSNFVF